MALSPSSAAPRCLPSPSALPQTSWLRLGLTILLISAQPLLALGVYRMHAAPQPATSPTAEVPVKIAPQPIAPERRQIMPVDRGAPAYTVGSGSR